MEKGKQQTRKKGESFETILGYLVWPVFIIYSLAVIYGALHHEPWRDEAETWLIVRDNNLQGLFKIIPFEEHPPLWFLIMMPIAKLGMPYSTISYLPAIIMIAAVYLLLFKTTLPFLVKLLLPFSYIFFYEYSVISRNYCLGIFFIAAIISLYPKRFDKPLLFALCVTGLFNSEGLAFGVGFALLVLYVIDAIQFKKLRTRVWIAIIIMSIGGFYLIPYMVMNPAANLYEGMIIDSPRQVANAIIGALVIDGSSVIALLIWAAIIVVLIARTKSFFIFISGAVCVLYILGYKYNLGYPRHFGLLFVVAIVAFGISEEYEDDRLNIIKINKFNPRAFGAWLFAFIVLLQAPYTFASYKDDLENDFSGSKSAAKFLNNQNLQNTILVGHQAWAASAIMPYLPIGTKFYYAECQRYGTYYVYDSCFLKNNWHTPPEYAVDICYQNFKDRLADLVFVFNRPLNDRSMAYMDLLYQSPKPPITKDEAFYIYRFKHIHKAE